MVSRFEKFAYLISELSKLLHKLESDELLPLGLKGPYAIYILTIARHECGVSLSDLSELCARDKADVSRAVAALTEKGIAKKVAEGAKKYKSKVVLTEEGSLLAQRLSQRAQSAVDFASFGVAEEKRAIFYDTLEVIYANMRKMSETGVPK